MKPIGYPNYETLADIAMDERAATESLMLSIRELSAPEMSG